MTADSAWSMTGTHATRITALLAYVDDTNGAIDDHVRHMGQLDDALLVDIDLDGHRGELDDYAEFSRYRQGEQACLGAAETIRLDRQQWQVARESERPLEQRLRRVSGSIYDASIAERIFHVC